MQGAACTRTLSSITSTPNEHGKIARSKARRDSRRSVRLARVHHRRRQGRRHGVRPRRARPIARDARRRSPLQHARRISRADAADRSARAGRHHAHVRQHQRPADHSRAALREQPRHAGRAGQRHHAISSSSAADSTSRSRRGRFAPRRSTISNAATSIAPTANGVVAPISACTA